MNFRDYLIILIFTFIMVLPLFCSLVISFFTKNYFLIGFGGCLLGIPYSYLILNWIVSNNNNLFYIH